MKKWKYTVSKNGRHQISDVRGGNVCMIWNCRDKEENAHLIAAAPEMYDMLDDAWRVIYDLIDEVNDQRVSRVHSQTETPPDLYDMESIHLIQTLLAKARGEQ